MKTKFIEATDATEFNWGKFMVCRFDAGEWARQSEMDKRSLLLARGWTHAHVLVVDLETGEGAIFRSGGHARADLNEKHQIWVCPMFEWFLTWLYQQDLDRSRCAPKPRKSRQSAHGDAGTPAAAQGHHRSESMITDGLLKGMCLQAANMAKTDLRYRHQLNGILAIYNQGEGLHRLRKIEQFAEEKVGKDWLNSGRAKDMIFGALCGGATRIEPDAIVICTGVDQYQQTPAFDALPYEERQRIAHSGHPRDLPAYFQPHDALMAVAQTPERACLYLQKMQVPGFLLIGEPKIHFLNQSEFDGRLKMYGVELPHEVGEALEKINKRRAN